MLAGVFMKKCYFIINGVKFVFVYKNEKIEILKEEKNQLLPLNEENQKIIDKLFTYDNRPICKSLRLSQAILSNNNLDLDLNIIELLKWLEQTIPEDCRENFYRNLQTLKVNQNLDAIHNLPVDEPQQDRTVYTAAYYSADTNTITINDNFISLEYKESQNHDNQQEYFVRKYLCTLLHEMSHMASSNFDPETGILHSGFDSTNDRNTGLNEGMTEVIAMCGIPDTREMDSGYYMESCLVNQLICIIGKEEMIRSYFKAIGIDNIKQQLTQFGISNSEASYLFSLIECNYLAHQHYDNFQTNALSEIQSTLLDCFNEKCKHEICSIDFDIEKLKNAFNIYENMLVTPSLLKQMGINQNNYVDLIENIEKFQLLKDTYIPKLNSKINGDINESKKEKEQTENVTKQQDIFDQCEQDFEEYREFLKKVYLEEKDYGEMIYSHFRVINNIKPMCEHIVEKVNKTEVSIISKKVFAYDDDFREHILNPLIVDYAQCSPIINSEVKKDFDLNELKDVNNGYQAFSENNNVLSITNISHQYTIEVSNIVQQTEPTIYSKHMLEKQENKKHQSYNGFASNVILSVIVGIVCLLIFILGIWVLT